jgi:hypothetical protein
MLIINSLASVVLFGISAGLAMFYIGSAEQHALLMQEHFWSTFALRFGFASILGLVGASMWWGVNILLVKSGFVKSTMPSKIALVIAAAPIGALVGTLIFCFA